MLDALRLFPTKLWVELLRWEVVGLTMTRSEFVWLYQVSRNFEKVAKLLVMIQISMIHVTWANKHWDK